MGYVYRGIGEIGTPVAETQIQSMSNKHMQILEYIVANPAVKMKAVAQQFEVSIAWLSVIIRSDCFQQRLAEIHQDIIGDTLLEIDDRLTGLAHKALDKLDEELDLAKGVEAPQQVAEMALKNLGYGSKAPIQAQNVFMVDPTALRKARQKIGGRTIEGDLAELPPSEGRTVGEFDDRNAEVRKEP